MSLDPSARPTAASVAVDLLRGASAPVVDRAALFEQLANTPMNHEAAHDLARGLAKIANGERISAEERTTIQHALEGRYGAGAQEVTAGALTRILRDLPDGGRGLLRLLGIEPENLDAATGAVASAPLPTVVVHDPRRDETGPLPVINLLRELLSKDQDLSTKSFLDSLAEMSRQLSEAAARREAERKQHEPEVREQEIHAQVHREAVAVHDRHPTVSKTIDESMRGEHLGSEVEGEFALAEQRQRANRAA